MKIIKLVQGSPEWHQHRANHFNASDAPAMLGLSKYKTRSQLLHELHTGSAPEVDAGTQQRFNDGHRFEALARPLAEEIIGDELSPVVGAEGKLSASFDGITFGGDVIFEHKTLNDKIRDAFASNVIPAEYCAQMEQQLMISGATKCLFMASKFDGNDALIEELHCWYESDQAMRDNIVQGWTQFSIDLAAYVPPEVITKEEADPIMQLPAVIINATGGLSTCNLDEIKPKWDVAIAEAKIRVATTNITNGKAIGKHSRETAKVLKLKAKEVVDQISTVSEAVRTLELYAAEFDKIGLAYEKEVTKQEAVEEEAALNKVRAEYADHVSGLQAEVEPIRLVIPQPDFTKALARLRDVNSKNNALSTALANAKIAADAAAKDIRTKLAWCKEHAAGMSFLFHDLQQIITKPMDDFTLLIKSRIKDHKEAEARKAAELIAKIDAENAAKLEAERARMQQEEEAKARAKVEAEQAESRAKAEAEAKEIAKFNQQQIDAKVANEAAANEAAAKIVTAQPAQAVQAPTGGQPQEAGAVTPKFRPTRLEMIMSIADSWDVHKSVAEIWLCDEFRYSMKVAA